MLRLDEKIGIRKVVTIHSHALLLKMESLTGNSYKEFLLEEAFVAICGLVKCCKVTLKPFRSGKTLY